MRAQIRRGFILGTIGYVLVVVVILTTLISLVQGVRTAESQLATVNARLSEARDSLATTQASLDDLQKQYAAVSTQKTAAEQALTESRRQIEELKKQLNQIYDFKPHVVPVNEIDEKVAYSVVGQQGFDILRQAIEDANRKLPFNGANSPQLGFTSPAYATYLLSKVGVNQPIDQIKRRNGPPRNGDIIIYAGGYMMFYFHLPENKKEFVIGMTPQGVLSLDPKFGLQISVAAALSP
jgi:cell fate (sporulation/competence/biofilm development) regulator YmcA (YheA/YmcA/DUF963 family)